MFRLYTHSVVQSSKNVSEDEFSRKQKTKSALMRYVRLGFSHFVKYGLLNEMYSFGVIEETKPSKVLGVCLCIYTTSPKSFVLLRHLRWVWLCVTLQEEAHALLVWPVGIEARHHHYLPWKVPNKAGWAEHRLTQAAEALYHKPESCLWPPTGVCGKMEGEEKKWLG